MAVDAAAEPKQVAPLHDRARITELDGLRGIAILLVLLTHFYPTMGPLKPLGPFLRAGWVGVDLFFVLSGYLITGILVDSAGREHYYRNFFVRRSLRIFPLYYLCVPLYCVLIARYTDFWNALAASKAPFWFAAYLGNLQIARHSAWPAGWLFGPLWSLQVEEQFYVTFPFVVARLRAHLAKLLIAGFFAAFALRVLILLLRPGNLDAAYVLMPCRMDALAIGGLIAVLQRESPEWLSKRWMSAVAVVSGTTFCAMCATLSAAPRTPVMRTFGFSVLAILFGSVLVLLVVQRQKHLIWICRLRPLMWLGTISYGLYILQLPVAMFTRYYSGRFLHVVMGSTKDFALCMVAAVLAAWFSWVFFESPLLRLKKRFTS